MPYTEFGQIARLNTAIQRALLQNGDPLERVWAAWALGMHLGSTAIPDLLTSVADRYLLNHWGQPPC